MIFPARFFLLLCAVAPWVGAQTDFRIRGYIQGRFTNQEGTSDRLEVRRARIIVSGEPGGKFSYVVQVDAAKRPYLMDTAVSWRFMRSLRITAGQFKIPFSAESIVSDNVNAPVSRARAVLSLAPGRDTGVQARDTGFQIAGDLIGTKRPLIQYTAGVFRGQLLVNSPAIHYRATVGRLLLSPIRGLTIGGDWYGSFSTRAAVKRRWESEGSYDRGSLHFRAEQIWARDGMLERRGGYGLGSWRAHAHWEPLGRVDWLTTNTSRPNTTSVAYMAGVNFYYGTHVKVGANTGAQHDQGPRGFSSLFLAQTMLMF